MIRFFKWIIFGHIHKWKVIEDREITKNDTGTCVGFIKVLQCEKCGELKDFTHWI